MVYTVQNIDILRSPNTHCSPKSATLSYTPVEQPDQRVQTVESRRPRRRMSFEEAKAATFAQYDETFQRLADAG